MLLRSNTRLQLAAALALKEAVELCAGGLRGTLRLVAPAAEVGDS
jgi:hypothetical protein